MSARGLRTLVLGLALGLFLGWSGSGPGALAASDGTPGDAAAKLDKVKRALETNRAKAERLRKKAEQIDLELERLRRDMVATAQIIQEQERRAGALSGTLKALRAKEAAKTAELKSRRGQLAGVLVALERVARYPPEALMTQPMHPSDTVRSAILLRAAVPEIEHRATRLRVDLEELAQARREIVEKNAQLASVTSTLENERQRLAAMFGQKTALKHRTHAESQATARRLKSLAGRAASLRELMDRLAEEQKPLRLEKKRTPRKPAGKADAGDKPADEAPVETADATGLPEGITGTPISTQRGKLPSPVVGRIVGRYGQVSNPGLTRRGLSLQTAAGAQVVAPYEGRVVFAGKFRGYGELLIIEHGEGYHSLLAGMARIDATMGQWVVAGEPVGVMGRPDDRKPVLYIEFRRNGQPINPLPWLAARR